MKSKASLAPRELYRYEWRTELFLTKYRNGLPLTLVSGGEVILERETAVENLIERRGNSRFTMKGIDGKNYTLSSFAKTPEFGGGGGMCGGSAMTKLTESAQAVYCQALQYSTLLKLPSVISLGHRRANVDESLDVILNDVPNDWVDSCIIGANALNVEFSGKYYQYHRGSKWVNDLEALFKKLNAKERIFSNLNKWSPADIYMISDIGSKISFDNIESIIELNKVLVDAFNSKDILGVSLKLLNKTAKISYHNIGEDDKKIKFNGISIGRTGFFSSKDSIVYFDDTEKIQFRTFPETFQGEIKGKNACHGKIGYGPIQTVLRSIGLPTMTYIKKLRQQIEEGDPDMFEEFHFMYVTHCNDSEVFDIDTFTAKCKEKGSAWIFSKVLSLQLVNIIVKFGRGNEFVTACIRYASSSSEHSAPFVKLE